MFECWMSPCFLEKVVGLEREQLRAGSRTVREMRLDKQPPLVGNSGRGKGQEVARAQFVALRSQSISIAANGSQILLTFRA